MHFVTSVILVLFATLVGSAVAAPVHHKFVRSVSSLPPSPLDPWLNHILFLGMDRMITTI